MTDTLDNIKITSGEPTDIYLASGIASGTKIVVQNIGACDVSLLTKETEPTKTEFINSNQIVMRGEWAGNESGDSGAWAYCNNQDGLINVRIA